MPACESKTVISSPILGITFYVGIVLNWRLDSITFISVSRASLFSNVAFRLWSSYLSLVNTGKILTVSTLSILEVKRSRCWFALINTWPISIGSWHVFCFWTALLIEIPRSAAHSTSINRIQFQKVAFKLSRSITITHFICNLNRSRLPSFLLNQPSTGRRVRSRPSTLGLWFLLGSYRSVS